MPSSKGLGVRNRGHLKQMGPHRTVRYFFCHNLLFPSSHTPELKFSVFTYTLASSEKEAHTASQCACQLSPQHTLSSNSGTSWWRQRYCNKEHKWSKERFCMFSEQSLPAKMVETDLHWLHWLSQHLQAAASPAAGAERPGESAYLAWALPAWSIHSPGLAPFRSMSTHNIWHNRSLVWAGASWYHWHK